MTAGNQSDVRRFILAQPVFFRQTTWSFDGKRCAEEDGDAVLGMQRKQQGEGSDPEATHMTRQDSGASPGQ
jgi:hypothetical protein